MLRINFSKLSTKVLGNLANRALAVLLPYLETLMKDNPLVTILKTKNDNYQEVVIKKTYSGLGDPVGEADLHRDRMFRGLRRALQGLAAFGDTDAGKAAVKLLDIFDEVGDIDNLSYADQNIVMQKLVEHMDDAENQKLLAATNLTDPYIATKMSQTAFETISRQQTDANSLLRQTKSASASRKELENSLRNLFSVVSGMRTLPEWKPLYHDLDQLIKEARQSNRDEKDKPNESKASI